MSDIEAILTTGRAFSWSCMCGAVVSFQIDQHAQVECTCRTVYVWDGRGFVVKHWSLRSYWEGDEIVYERVLV